MAKYLPAFDEIEVQQNGREVAVVRLPTVCSLLTHTSGLSCDYLEDFPVAEQYRQVGICANASRTLEQMIAELARLAFSLPAGDTLVLRSGHRCDRTYCRGGSGDINVWDADYWAQDTRIDA